MPANAAVLVVDDDESLLEFTTRVLEEAGYQVTPAAGASDALSAAAQRLEPFALLITNVSLHRMSGPALARQIGVVGHRPPVLYVSRYSRETPSLRRLLRDADELVVAPFTPERLLGCVRYMIVAA
jgi:DNA-binding response OmpR family regulator